MATVWVTFISILVAIALAFGGIYQWSVFLHGSRSTRTRRALYVFVALVQVVDMLIYRMDYTKRWHVWLCTFCNLWGMLDAVARFPALHEFESLFTIKQVILVAVKTLAYALGFVNLSRDAMVFLLSLFFNVWFLPLLYLMALPITEPSLAAQKNPSDVDIFFKLGELLTSRESRSQTFSKIKFTVDAALNRLGRQSPVAGQILSAVSTSHARRLRPGVEEI